MGQVRLGLARSTRLANDVRREVSILMVGLGTYPTLALSNSSHLFTVADKPSKAPGGGVLSLSLRSSDFLVILSLIDSFSVPPASTSGTRVALEASLNPNTFLSYKCRAY